MAVFTAAATIGATVLGTIGVGAGTAAAFGTGLFLAQAAIGFLTQAAVGLALNALAPKPSSESKAGIGGYRLNGKRSNLDRQVIYGQTRVGGAIVFDSNSNDIVNSTLYRVIVHAGHPIEGYEEVFIDGEKITSWKVASTGQVITKPSEVPNGLPLTPNGGRYESNFFSNFSGSIIMRFFDGTQTTADTRLVSYGVGWTNNHVLNNCAYVSCNIFHGLGDDFPNGVPEILCTVKGKKLYDPRTDTTVWSDNPALCLRDYLASDYGLSEPSENIDDTLVAAAANVCDETSTVSGAKRYTCNGAFTTAVTPIDLLSEMLTSMGGLLWYAQGKWRMKPAYYVAPTVSFTEDDLRSSIAVKTRHSRRDNFNIVKGTFKGPESAYEFTDYPEMRNQDFVDADNGVESVIDLNLPFTDTADEARRIARIFLERNRQQLTISASFGMRAFQVQVGDIIELTVDRFGWDQKEFEVASWTFGLTDAQDLQVQMTLREISASVFDEIDDGEIYERDNTNLPNPFLDEAPKNLTVSDGGFTAEDGTFVNSFIVDWDEPDAQFVNSYVVEWRRQGESKYNSVILRTTEYQIAPVVENVVYDIRVKGVNAFGVSGPYAETTAQVGGDTTAPGLPTDISATGGFKYITIDWTNPADADLNYIEVWENTTNTTSGATLVGEVWGNQFVRTNLDISETRFYFLRAVDYSGNTSGYTSGVSGTTTFIDDPDFENGIRSLFEDQGLFPIEDVNGLPASGITGRKVFNRQDGKLYEWNGSDWILVISAVEAPDIDGQLTDAQIADLAAAKLTGQITETQISDDSISTPKLQAGSISTAKIAANAVTANEIAASSITSNEIAANTITANEIATGTITASEIAGNTITGDKISANTITGGLLATSGIITNSAQIDNGLITNAKIQNAAITTAKIGNNQVTFPQFSTGVTNADYAIPSSEAQIASITISQTGAPAWIFAEAIIAHTDGSVTSASQYGSFNLRLKRNGSTISSINGLLTGGFNSPSFILDTTSTSFGTTTYSFHITPIGGNDSFVRVLSTSIFIVELKR